MAFKTTIDYIPILYYVAELSTYVKISNTIFAIRRSLNVEAPKPNLNGFIFFDANSPNTFVVDSIAKAVICKSESPFSPNHASTTWENWKME